MQIQLGEGRVLRCAEAALQGTARDTSCPEIGYGEKVSRRLSLSAPEEKICLLENQRDTERAEARRVFALERMASCCRFDQRWRAKLDLGSGEPFDDLHGSATLGTAIKTRSVFGAGGVFFGR